MTPEDARSGVIFAFLIILWLGVDWYGWKTGQFDGKDKNHRV